MGIYRVNGKVVSKKEFLEGCCGLDFTAGGPSIGKPFAYISPMSGKEITDRAQRREEMKKYNVREVPPEEYGNMLKDRGFDERRGS